MYIIAQKIKKRTRPRRVTGTFLDILYQIKKAPANARASTTTTMMPYCGLRGGDILLFVFLVFVVYLFTFPCNRPSTDLQPIEHCQGG